MKKLLSVLFSLITLIAFTGCDKEEDEVHKETKLQTTAGQLKGTWRWTYLRETYYDKDGNIGSDRTNSNVRERFSFDGKLFQNLTDSPNSTKYPYTLTEADGKIFYKLEDGRTELSGVKNKFTEITSISSDRMSWHIQYDYTNGGKTVHKMEFTKEF